MNTKDTALFASLSEEQQGWPVLSFSQLQQFNRCEYKWWLGYKLEYTPTEKKKSLEIGGMIHEGLADWYTVKMECYPKSPSADRWVAEQLPILASQWLSSESSEAVQNAGLVVWLLDRYVHQSEFEDAGHRVLAVEHHFLIPCRTKDGHDFLLQGYVDLVTETNLGIWIWDHKSGQQFWSKWAILMEPQLPTYAIALRETGVKAVGHVINQLRTYDYKDKSKVPNEKLFKRDSTHRTDTELRNIAKEILTAADPWYNASVEADFHPTRKMDKECERCDFADPCLAALKGIPVEVILDDSFKKKNPQNPQSNQQIEIEGIPSL